MPKIVNLESFWKIHMRHLWWFLNTVHHHKNQIKTSTVIGFASICKDTTQKNTFGFFGGCILCIGYTCRVLCNNEANNMQNKTKTKLKRKAKHSQLTFWSTKESFLFFFDEKDAFLFEFMRRLTQGQGCNLAFIESHFARRPDRL